MLFNAVIDGGDVLEGKREGIGDSLELAKGYLYCSKKRGENPE